MALALASSLLCGCGRGGASHAVEAAGRNGAEAAQPDSARRGTDQPGRNEGEGEARQVVLSPEAVKRAGIEVGRAGPASIAVTVGLPGEVRLDGERVIQVRPRFAGVVRDLRKRIGDRVRSGEVLALIQSNESLTDYEVNASMAGTVISRDVAMGQAVDQGSVLYTIADLSMVWVDFAVYPQQLGTIRRGQSVQIVSQSGGTLEAIGTISYVGPVLEEETRVSVGRVVLANPDGRWQPGLFVTASVELERRAAPVAVPEEAIVRTRDGRAVFVAEGSTFRLRPVTTGRTDGQTTEIVQGLEAGTPVVVRNAFLLKAELEKSEFAEE
jgi:multidrug efflux pump subunit AcrA (membrane-fusion protein)